MHAKNARKPIRNDKSICFRRPSPTSSSSAPLRHWLEFAFAWENRPRPDGIRIRVAPAATQVAIPSGRLLGPDGTRLCVALSPPAGRDSPLRGETAHATRDPVRRAHATARVIRFRPRSSRSHPVRPRDSRSRQSPPVKGTVGEGRRRPPERPALHGSGGAGIGLW